MVDSSIWATLKPFKGAVGAGSVCALVEPGQGFAKFGHWREGGGPLADRLAPPENGKAFYLTAARPGVA